MSKRRQDLDLGIISKKRVRRISNNNNVPVELIHAIQSLLPLKEGVRSCILSKSWQSAWYTLPTLKLTPPEDPDYFDITQENQTKYNQLIHTTLHRYHAESTPIQSFLLQYCVIQESYIEDVQNWIRLVVSKSSLKHLSLDIRVCLEDDLSRFALPDDDDHHDDDDDDHHSPLALPNELFSSQALHTIHVSGETSDLTHQRLGISSTHVINCVSLRVLHLECLFIHQDMLNNVLSTCRLLEKIKLISCRFDGLKIVNLKNLLRLTYLDICSTQDDDLWDIHNVPSLSSFCYRNLFAFSKPIPFQIDSLPASVTRLCVDGFLNFNKSFFKALEKFHVLESLTVVIKHPELVDLVFTCASLKWLTLHLLPTGPVVNVQVYAPKLLSFSYTGKIPCLLFPTTAPEKVELTFNSWETLGHSYFLRIRQALNSSSKFVINIRSDNLDVLVERWNIDVDDLKREAILPPVGNIELVLQTDLDEHAWEQSPFFDAFFLICHPSYIRSSNKVIRKMMEGITTYPLKEVLLKNRDNGNWEALTSSWKSVLHTLTGVLECKLIWFPQ